MASEAIEILTPEESRRTITRLASQIVERAGDLSTLVLIGIHTRGVPLAKLLAAQIQHLEGISIPFGSLDITFYRDDLDRIGARTPEKTNLPFDLAGKQVVLVDDVITKDGRCERLLMP